MILTMIKSYLLLIKNKNDNSSSVEFIESVKGGIKNDELSQMESVERDVHFTESH